MHSVFFLPMTRSPTSSICAATTSPSTSIAPHGYARSKCGPISAGSLRRLGGRSVAAATGQLVCPKANDLTVPLRQRPRRDDQWPVQDRSDPAARAVALAGGRRIRHPRLGGLVQQPPPPRADRQYAARRGRGTLLCRAQASRPGSLTQANQPPAKPRRFNSWIGAGSDVIPPA